MSLATFESLLRHPAPGFACYASGDKSKTEAFLAPIAHRAKSGARAGDLASIPDVPGADAARQFYQSHNGALLFTAPGSMSAFGGPDEGLEIFPIKQWKSRTEQMVDSWEDGEYKDDRMPYGRDDFIAFAHSRGASSYMHWVIDGPNSGSIYWWAWTMPPQKKTPPLATDFALFVELVCMQPVHFFNDLLLCYTRFSDGQTGKQWIPIRYLPDRRPYRLLW
jgi:hypothetical protein